MDRLLVDLTCECVDQFAQIGGFVGADGNGVDVREAVGGPEGRLYAGEWRTEGGRPASVFGDLIHL